MASPALLNSPGVFYHALLSALRRNGHPMFPDRRWFQSLALAIEADTYALRQLERHKLDAIHFLKIGYRQQYRVPEHRETLGPGDRSAAIRQLEKRCDEFLISRGLERGFHQY